MSKKVKKKKSKGKIKTQKEKMKRASTDKYKFCNHHHRITNNQKMVDFGKGKFVADKIAIPLLKALNAVGLETRTHHIDESHGFVGIILDNVTIEMGSIFERNAMRTKYNGKFQLLISWNRTN